jgi:hypothetical protein
VEDPSMLDNGTSTSFGTFSSANTKVDADKVKENMDKMACALADNADSQKAWETILRKPTAKDWGDVIVAIKPNCAAGSSNGQSYPHALIAIINTVCNVLIGFGAKGSNMTIYDICSFSKSPSTFYPANSMVSGIKFAGPGSGTYNTSPYNAATVVRDADIIINIASCKGHAQVGRTTLTLKNHIGTMKLSCPSGVQDMIDIHNSEAILGNPISGSVPAKQQLNIIDCLWTASGGPTAAPDKAPCMLVMGTLSPAVDCFTAIKLRLEEFNYSGTRSTFISYLTRYGYDADDDVEPLLVDPSPDPDEFGRAWLNVDDWVPTSIKTNPKTTNNKEIELFVNSKGIIKYNTSISINRNEKIRSVDIYNLRGTLIKSISHSIPNSQRVQITWDGRNTSGKLVPAGTYVVTIKGTKSTQSGKISLQK